MCVFCGRLIEAELRKQPLFIILSHFLTGQVQL